MLTHVLASLEGTGARCVVAANSTGAQAPSLLQIVSHRSRAATDPSDAEEPQVFFASPDAEDVHASVQKCVDDLKAATAPQSSCKLRSGTYHLKKPVLVDGFTADIPKFITSESADPKQRPKFDGTIDITDYTWTATVLKNCPSGCYEAELEDGEAPWQLFIGEEMFLNARWPNAKWSDKSLFEATKGWAQSSDKSTFSGPSNCAKDPEEKGSCPTGFEKVMEGVGAGVCLSTSSECLAGKAKGFIPSVGAAECSMDDATTANEYGSKPLGEEDFDATGASVILNLGHWTSYTSKVKSHSPKSNRFTYDSRFGWNVVKYIADHTMYYLENSIELLDSPEEWFYDLNTRKIYIMPPKGETPTSWAAKAGRITARIQTYAIEITEAKKLTLSNIDFFATTIYAAGKRGPWDPVKGERTAAPLTEHAWDNLIFKYPSTGKRMLGDVDYISPTTMLMYKSHKGPVNNAIRNSRFYYVEGPTIEFGRGQTGITVENNIFEWIDWTATTGVSEVEKRAPNGLCYPIIKAKSCFGLSAGALLLPAGAAGSPNRVVRNTLFHHGASSGIGFFGGATGSSEMLVELNCIADKKDLQLDGGQITIPSRSTSGTVLRKNWAYDSNPARHHATKWGLRFDRPQSECSQDWGKHGAMHNNVVFNTNGLNIKGNEHKVVQNTVFKSNSLGGKLDDPNANSKFVDVNLYASRGGIGTCECTDIAYCKKGVCCTDDKLTKENALTEVTGNLMDLCRGGEGGVPWKVSTKEVDDKYIRDQGIESASFNVAGEGLEEQLRDPDNFDFRPRPDTVASRQCIGAYADVPQDGTAEYWIPGFQDSLPTMPVPPDKNTMKKTGALAFNQALGADYHRVFISTAETADGGYQKDLVAPNNIIGLPATYSTAKTTYYWRVDPVFGGTSKRGTVWQYKVVDEETSAPPVSSVLTCKKFSGPVGPTKKTWNAFTLDVPANAGLEKRFKLKHTKICVHAAATFTPQYQLRVSGKRVKMLGAFWGQKIKITREIPEIHGCFTDEEENHNFAPSSIKPGATWKLLKARWEKDGTLNGFMNLERLNDYPRTFALKIRDQKKTGELKSWSMEFCFEDAAADQTLPAAGTGACSKYSYK